MKLYTKRIDELGRVVIPKSIRTKLGIIPDDYVEMNYLDGKIEIRKDKGLQETSNYENMIKLIRKVYDYDIVLCNKIEIKSSTIDIKYEQLVDSNSVIIKEKPYFVNKFVINIDSKIEGHLYVLSNKLLSDESQNIIKKLIDYFTNKQ